MATTASGTAAARAAAALGAAVFVIVRRSATHDRPLNAQGNDDRGRGWPMQAWLFLLILAVTLPLGGLLLWNAQEDARDSDAAASRYVGQTAQVLAAETDQFLADTRSLLDRIATRPSIVALDRASCDPLFTDVRSSLPRYRSLLLLDRQGEVVCSSSEALVPEKVADDLPGFRAAVAGEPFHIDAPRRGADAQPILLFTAPIAGEGGAVVGALVAGVDLARFPAASLASTRPAGALLEIVHRDGVFIARSSAPERIGTRASPALLEVVLRSEGPVRLRRDDGLDYRLDVAPLTQAPWFAVASVSHAEASTRQRLQQSIGLAALLLLGIWAAATIAMSRMLRPLAEIARAAKAIARGDSTARVRSGGPREVDAIATAFNRLLDHREQFDSALHAGEVRYRSLFETSSDAIIGLALDNRILFANPAIEQLTGWKPEELVGQSLARLQPASLREPHLAAIRRFVAEPGATLRNRSTETRCLHRDGHEIPIEITFSAAHVAGSAYFVGFIRDITDRHAAVAELRESEKRFRVMADSSPVLIWTADAVVREFYFNATWLAFAGQTLEQAREAGWYGGVHPDDVAAVQQVIDRANEHHRGCTLEYRRLRHDGEYRWVLDTSAPRFDDTGRFVGYVGTAVDIHDRVIAESRIRRLTALYGALSRANEAIARSADVAAMLQTVCDVVVRHTGITTAMVSLLDASGTKLSDVAFSGDFAEVFSRSPLEVAAQPEGMESPGSLVVRTNRRHVSADRHADASVWRIAQPEARAVLRSSAVFPLQRDGKAVGVFAVYAREPAFFDAELTDLVDILTSDLSYALEAFAAREDRAKAESELRRLNATLEERVEERTRSLEAANRELEAFSYSVSHDLRAPLRGISGFSQLLHEGYAQQLDETGRGYVERVKAAATKMARLIDDLLNLSRITLQAIHRVPVDVSALAAEIVDDLREAHRDRQVDVTIEPGLTANADAGLTRILFANLLDNAWKFTSQTPQAHIDVASAVIDGRRGFVVRDNGAGFDSAYADTLFAPFQRLHGEAEFPGTGIGLAIVQRIVHRHEGQVTVEASVGRGAAFAFTLGA
jgi:PAS domain S-box-containing protein